MAPATTFRKILFCAIFLTFTVVWKTSTFELKLALQDSHNSDFSIQAEWYFHATTHGKEPCDKIRVNSN